MSSLIVEVCRIEKVQPHGNAERLELAVVKGWQCVVNKGKYAAGDLVTYVPVDSVLPSALAERLGVAKYLSNGRVRCAKLRGEPSFGLIIDLENPDWREGADVREHYGITKYIPPVKLSDTDADVEDPLFASYTEIENMRNFPTILQDGEEVVASEKIHGTNCRVGRILGELMAGSKTLRRKPPAAEQMAGNMYWHPLSTPAVKSLLDSFAPDKRQVILFGEVYGRVQSLRYGESGIRFRAFDLMIDGKYVDYDVFVALCQSHGVEVAPLIYRGPFSLEAIRAVSDGPSTLPGASNIREGVVVRPVIERNDPKVGRVILKYIGDTYLFGDQSDTNDV